MAAVARHDAAYVHTHYSSNKKPYYLAPKEMPIAEPQTSAISGAALATADEPVRPCDSDCVCTVFSSQKRNATLDRINSWIASQGPEVARVFRDAELSDEDKLFALEGVDEEEFMPFLCMLLHPKLMNRLVALGCENVYYHGSKHVL